MLELCLYEVREGKGEPACLNEMAGVYVSASRAADIQHLSFELRVLELDCTRCVRVGKIWLR